MDIYVDGICTLKEYTQIRIRPRLEYLHFWVHERGRLAIEFTGTFSSIFAISSYAIYDKAAYLLTQDISLNTVSDH